MRAKSLVLALSNLTAVTCVDLPPRKDLRDAGGAAASLAADVSEATVTEFGPPVNLGLMASASRAARNGE